MSSEYSSFSGSGIPLLSDYDDDDSNTVYPSEQNAVLNTTNTTTNNTSSFESATTTTSTTTTSVIRDRSLGAYPKNPSLYANKYNTNNSNSNSNTTNSTNFGTSTSSYSSSPSNSDNKTSSSSTTTTTTNSDPKINNDSDKKNEFEKNSGLGDDADDKKDESMFECNICLDTAKDAVVSLCGHLFCWPCLHQWLETRPTRKLCPVCKAAISKEKVIPLYGRNSTKQEDPRNKVPPRPAGQRTEPEQAPGFQGFGFGDGGFHMSFGIGAFPFGYFASSFNFGEPRGAANQRPSAQYEEEQHLSKIFLYLAVICIGWLLFA